ncbi:MAG: hypothetical protein ACON4Y_06095 [Flavobacteriales bacterium]
MKKLFLLFIVQMIFLNSFAQSKKIKSFSEQSDIFIEELNTFMLATPKEEVKKLMSKFTKDWKKGTYSSLQQNEIYEISNLMLKKRKRANHFISFFESLMAFSESPKFESEFSNWTSIVKSMISGSSSSKQLKFLVFSKNLFDKNILVTNRSLTWTVSDQSFSFDFDTVPSLVFDQSIDLTCFARGDTMLIRQTNGKFYPLKSNWIGASGLMSWEKAGFSLVEVYTELADYRINMSKAGLVADSVLFYNSLIFDDVPLKGVFEDRLVKRNRSESTSSYPKFDSYDKNIVLSDLIDDVDFKGGYSLHGNRFISSGGDGETADLIFYKDNRPFAIVSSGRIAISGKRVIASNASVKIKLRNDSILHPGLSLIYDQDERRLDLIRDGSGISLAPYVNTYHDLEMDFQNLKWYIDEDKILFGTIPGNTSSPAYFYSSEYFKENKFDRLLGLDKEHPLLRLEGFVKRYGVENTFLIDDFLKVSPYSDDQDISFLMKLASEGYLIYNSVTRKVIVKENASKHILAKSKKVDHDELLFESKMPSDNKNAVLDLNTMDLTIYGVQSIRLSSVRDVLATPNTNQVVVKKGRDFNMSGRIFAGNNGRFRINAQDINFIYDEFKIYFKDASTEIWIPNNRGEYNQKGELVLEPVQSQISITNGELLVDTNINKSGIWQEDYPQFPIIRSYDRSKVFYDSNEILAGTYDRNRFFFDVEPFEIDSLDTYDRESLNFPGIFNSGDIFPSFQQNLKVQPDNILGFSISIPEEGYPLYVDKGFFVGLNNLSLNMNGLRGKGEFQYLNSITNSDDFVFFLDSMNTHANSFELVKKIDEVGFPNAKAIDVYEHWEPYNDILIINNKSEEFNVYDNKLTLDGKLELRPDGLQGAGLISLENSKLSSELFSFRLEDFEADTADFTLNRTDVNEIAFESVNLKTQMNLYDRTAQFESNGKGSFAKFPSNQYICYIDQLKWYMDKKELVLGKSDDIGDGSKFVSVHEDQDSLFFFSKSSFYSLNDYIIKANGVDKIKVADAEIYPSDKKVIVRSNAKMDSFSKASMLINTIEKNHQIFDANLNVFGRNDYSGDGYVKYNGRGLQEQIIKLDTLFVLDKQSIGKGVISDNSNFKFNPQFLYKGKFKLEGMRKEFLYTGSYKVKHECSLISNGWVQFSDYVGKEKMELPVGDSILDEYGQQLYSGPILSGDQLYPAFLSTLESENDRPMMPINGYLSYDNNKSMFIITNASDSTDGYSTLTMSNSGCVMKGEGDFNFGMNFGQVEFNNTGEFTYNAMSNTLKSTSMLSLDFYMSDKAMDQFGLELEQDPMADELELAEKYYTNNFNRILSDPDLVFEYDMFGQFEKLPKELNKSLYFYEVQLEWDSETNSLISKNSLGLGNIKGYQINKLYTGRIELAKENGEDLFNIYLETDIGESYFFSYYNEFLITRSTIDDYNLEILGVKTQQKKLPTKKGEAQFQYDLSSEDDVDNFKKRFFR